MPSLIRLTYGLALCSVLLQLTSCSYEDSNIEAAQECLNSSHLFEPDDLNLAVKHNSIAVSFDKKLSLLINDQSADGFFVVELHKYGQDEHKKLLINGPEKIIVTCNTDNYKHFSFLDRFLGVKETDKDFLTQCKQNTQNLLLTLFASIDCDLGPSSKKPGMDMVTGFFEKYELSTGAIENFKEILSSTIKSPLCDSANHLCHSQLPFLTNHDIDALQALDETIRTHFGLTNDESAQTTDHAVSNKAVTLAWLKMFDALLLTKQDYAEFKDGLRQGNLLDQFNQYFNQPVSADEWRNIEAYARWAKIEKKMVHGFKANIEAMHGFFSGLSLKSADSKPVLP